jgi:hypothetical protein
MVKLGLLVILARQVLLEILVLQALLDLKVIQDLKEERLGVLVFL